MNHGADLAAGLPELRAAAESIMWDRCKIERATTTWSETDKKSVTTWTTVHADVACSMLTPPAVARQVAAGEVVTPQLPIVMVPLGTLGIEPDDRVTVTAVGPNSDPDLLGVSVFVTHNRVRSHPVKRRLECRWSL